MEENLNEMVIKNTINEVEENLTDEIIQSATKHNCIVAELVIGGVALAGFAIYKSSMIFSFSKPPSLVKNFKPLRLKGKWLAVIMMEPSMAVSGKTMDINMAGVDAI